MRTDWAPRMMNTPRFRGAPQRSPISARPIVQPTSAIGTMRTSPDIRTMSVIEGKPDIQPRATKFLTCPRGAAPSDGTMDSTPYRLPRRAMRGRLARPSGNAFLSGDVPKSPFITGAWWPPSAGRTAQETVVFYRPDKTAHIAKLHALAGGGALCNGGTQQAPNILNQTSAPMGREAFCRARGDQGG